MFAFYPLYVKSYGTSNEIHLKRISQVGEKIESSMITVNVEEADFNLYVVEVRLS
jgi:hypothetical protein